MVSTFDIVLMCITIFMGILNLFINDATIMNYLVGALCLTVGSYEFHKHYKELGC